MSNSLGAPAQPKQPSRKGKKAWRKNVDIAEVQSGLEALREEIIQGGPISEKPSDELFALDTTGSENIKTKYKLTKPLKVDEILAKRSAIPAVDSRKRGRITDGVVEQSNKRVKGDWVSKREVARLRQVADRTSHLDREHIDEDDTGFDLWTAAPVEEMKELALEYIPRPKVKVAPPTTKKPPQPLTASGKPVKAVRNPDAGTSYNPSFEEWDDLLNRAGAEEVAAEQARLAQAQAEAAKAARVAALGAADDAGVRTDNESEWEGFDTEADEPETLRAKRARRKTPAEKNKTKRRKEAERQAKHERRSADKQKQADQIVQAMLAIAEKDENAQALVQRALDNNDDESGDDTKLRRRKLGPHSIPEKSLELVLPDELQESLRQLKPEGNLLQDRFRNLLVNGKIESRKVLLQPKKKKTKATEKWSHKDFSIVV